MARTHSESSEDFEFIETPAAPAVVPPPENCGVRTTSVCDLVSTQLPKEDLFVSGTQLDQLNHILITR
jgi:hypothetical protein